MRIINCFRKRKAQKLYIESLKKSEEALNNILFRDGATPLYFSNTRYNLLLNTFSIKSKKESVQEKSVNLENNTSARASINAKISSIEVGDGLTENYGNKYIVSYDKDTEIVTIKDNIDKIKNHGRTITKVKKGEIFYTHFPVFHGEIAEFLPKNKIASAYIWYGLYRNIELYLCGSSKNVFSVDDKIFPKALWAPSAIEGPVNIFEKLVYEVVEKNNDITDDLTEGKSIFEILGNNIKDTVMNRYEAKSFLQWQDMIVYCTAIEEKNGIRKIFGVPIFVVPSSSYDYGWYNIDHEGRYGEKGDLEYHPNNKDRFFEYENGGFTGRFLTKIDSISMLKKSVDTIDVVDANSAYKMNSYVVKRINNIPKTEKVEKCDDIIGICMERNLNDK